MREEEAKAMAAGKKKKKKSGGKGDPPINLLISLLGRFKLEVKHIHIRFEDDYF